MPAKTKAKVTRSKKYQEATTLVDKNQRYSLNEAVELAQKVSYSKFSGTLEAHLNTRVKNLRGLVTLPHFAGKKLRILVFSSKEPEKSEDIIVGTEDTINQLAAGENKVNFDVVVATPDWMPKLAKAAKVLGPRGLMPNPKSGTVTDNLEKAITDLQQGKVEYKTQANSQVIHLALGKVNQPKDEIAANLKALFQTIGKSRISSITLAPTMGPGVKVDITSI